MAVARRFMSEPVHTGMATHAAKSVLHKKPTKVSGIRGGSTHVAIQEAQHQQIVDVWYTELFAGKAR